MYPRHYDADAVQKREIPTEINKTQIIYGSKPYTRGSHRTEQRNGQQGWGRRRPIEILPSITTDFVFCWLEIGGQSQCTYRSCILIVDTLGPTIHIASS